MAQDHHVIPQQRIKQRRSHVAIKMKTLGATELTDAEARLLSTPLSQVLNDRRNIARISNTLHHRAHAGAKPYRIPEDKLPRGIHDFAAHFALEGALDRELRLIREAA